ncbi:hypothetical protein VZT92_020195 [Zoarces viviparus]|uniref:Uncharacterized protein n=1 Tax=Zoarces viviparus TaxID=48416 RepID=A0AAW1EF36_ZOAVI
MTHGGQKALSGPQTGNLPTKPGSDPSKRRRTLLVRTVGPVRGFTERACGTTPDRRVLFMIWGRLETRQEIIRRERKTGS